MVDPKVPPTHVAENERYVDQLKRGQASHLHHQSPNGFIKMKVASLTFTLLLAGCFLGSMELQPVAEVRQPADHSPTIHVTADSITLDHHFGTTLLSIYIPNERTIVAADSKTIGVTVGNEERILSGCKIRKIKDNVYFAATGLWGTRSASIPAIIAESFQSNPQVEEAMPLVETRLGSYLKDELAGIKKRLPERFQQSFDNLRHAQIIIFGLQNGSLFLHHRDFLATDDSAGINVQVTRQECPGKSCPSKEATFVFYGHKEGLEEYFNTHKPSELTLEWIKNAMAAAIKAAPDFVGPPVDIISINHKGAKWLQVKKECE
jgi:hypothetical protein